MWNLAASQVFNLPPKLYSQRAADSNMKHRLTRLPAGLTVIFLRYMPPFQLGFRREEIIKYSPPKNPDLRRNF
jgi:hypothetical protein